MSALNSGTSGLHLAFLLSNFKMKDIVYVSNSTYIATISPLLYCKGTPVFIDVEKQSGNMDLNLLENCIKLDLKMGKKPRAIVFTHNYGIPGNIDKLVEIKLKYNLILIEDAAEALGSEYKNQKCGTFSDYAIFSFNSNKIATTFGGGALIVNSANEKNTIQKLITHNKIANEYKHDRLGYNYRMNDLAAYMGGLQINSISEELERKASIHNYYKKHLNQSKLYSFVDFKSNDYKPNYWLNQVVLNKVDKLDSFIEFMSQSKIEIRKTWYPLHMQPFLNTYDFYGTNAAEIYKSHCFLPSSTELKREELEYIVDKMLFFESLHIKG